ncbi:MAG TPA: PilT/PilU family type 4a pilus ATPase [Kofleriaceae bacterium]|nr:PilT/PilU family type 4a pilus ATPase [Kofleriaceae bacterium]
MSAIVSLLRVMTLRDAEAITLEADKVPSLRRRGQVEPMAMPALDAKMLADFAAPLVAGKSLDDGPLMVSFADPEGLSYPITVEKTATGLRLVIRRPAPAKPSKPAPPPPVAPVASRPVSPAPAPAVAPIQIAGEHDRGRAIEAMHRLLAMPVAIAHERGASDVVLSTAQAPRVRVDGRLETLDIAIDDGELAACVHALAGDGTGVSADLSLDLDGVRVRVNAFDHLGGCAIAARLVREQVPTLANLALPAELGAVVDQRDGLVLVCGPTGSGKSTTLASLIDLLDQRRAAHVITLEDPIEYRFAARRCLIHQRELGTHIPSFAAGLRAALREAPDVILLGELRDRDTIAAALTAAETGHLVLATLHAPSAVGAIDRVIDAFPDSQQRQVRHQLAACLRTIVTQFLLPRKDGGRAPAIELVPVTPAVCNIIRKGDLHTLPTAIQSGREAGMIPLERSLARLIETGAVAPKVVQRMAADHDLLASLAGKLR